MNKKQGKTRRSRANKENVNRCNQRRGFTNKVVHLRSRSPAKKITEYLSGFISGGYASDTLVKNEDNCEVSKSDMSATSENTRNSEEQRRIRRSKRLQNKRGQATKDVTNKFCSKNKTNSKRVRNENKSKSIFMSINAEYSILPKTLHEAQSSVSFPKAISPQREERTSCIFRGSSGATLPDRGIIFPERNSIAHKNRFTQPPFLTQLSTSAISHPLRMNENCNRFFCSDLTYKIHVTFKKDALEECKKRINAHINNTNVVMAGKSSRNAEVDSLNSDFEDEKANTVAKILPIPPRNWVYETPRKKKPASGPSQKSKFQPALVQETDNFRILHEIKPCKRIGFLDDNMQDDQGESSTYFRRVAAIKKTPGFLQFASYGSQERRVKSQRLFDFEQPPKYNPLEGFMQSGISAPLQTNSFNVSNAEDITFVQDGDGFKMRPSQNKISQENIFGAGSGKMFDFNSKKGFFDF